MWVRARVEAYVAECERRLWQPGGRYALDWLTRGRGFGEETLRANRVGFDPGPEQFARPSGLPHRGEAVVLPALNERDRAIFYQARYLDPDWAGRKYDNTPRWLAPNPHVADVRTATARPDVIDHLLVTEGIPDALAAASAGYAAIAVLGTHNADHDLAERLAAEPRDLVLAFDGDDAGRSASDRLVRLLSEHARTGGIKTWQPPTDQTDLNDWLIDQPRTDRTVPLPVRRCDAAPLGL
jgi:DNA primase